MKAKSILMAMFFLVWMTGMGQGMKFGKEGYVERKMNLGDYTEVRVGSVIKLVFTGEVGKGEAYVVAKEKDMERVKVEAKDGVLYAKVEDKKGFFGFGNGRMEGEVKVYVSGDGVKDVKVSGAGKAVMREEDKVMRLERCKVLGAGYADLRVEAGDLEVTVSGAGSAKLDVKASKMGVDVSGAGVVSLKGDAERAEIEASGTGVVKAKELKVKKVEVSNSGVGYVMVYAEEEFEGSASGASKIEVYGDAKKYDSSTSGAGSIKRKQ